MVVGHGGTYYDYEHGHTFIWRLRMGMGIWLHDYMVEFVWDLNSYAHVQWAEMTWVQASEGDE